MTPYLGYQSHAELSNSVARDEVQVAELIEERLHDATAKCLPNVSLQRLRTLGQQYKEVLRLEFGTDPPAKVPQIEVCLRQGVTPVRCSERQSPSCNTGRVI
ncbi:hypothetical protein AeMF1_013605 [Aphanomyces euteiches]|nr:hypothetical protein AeMF1_013605 [Aphanomyces euteiches]